MKQKRRNLFRKTVVFILTVVMCAGVCRTAAFADEYQYYDEYYHMYEYVDEWGKTITVKDSHHYWDSEPRCYECGYECSHSDGWTENGYEHTCNICQTVQYHNWSSNGGGLHYCTECGAMRSHEYSGHEWAADEWSHTCTECYESSSHCWMPGESNYHQCGECGFPEFHHFDEWGYCYACGYSCMHSWMSGDSMGHYCMDCGRYEPHTYDSMGYCYTCGYSCMHSWMENWDSMSHYCMNCGTTMPHMYDSTGRCWECGSTCPHDWSGSWDSSSHYCMICGMYEPHMYDSTGYCMTCGASCEHSWMESWDSSKHVCAICGMEDYHMFDYNSDSYSHSCSICGMSSQHIYDGKYCTVCGRTCTHEFDEYSRCTICGTYCSNHRFNNAYYHNEHYCLDCGFTEKHHVDANGRCTLCGAYCEHTFSRGGINEDTHTCDDCGMTDGHLFNANYYCDICYVYCPHKYGYDAAGHCKACTRPLAYFVHFVGDYEDSVLVAKKTSNVLGWVASGKVPFPEGYRFYIDGTEIDPDTYRVLATTTADITITAVKIPAKPVEKTYSDVKRTDWYYFVVKEASEKGIMTGSADGTFHPEDPMSRGMVVTVLHRLAGYPKAPYSSLFTDVPAGQYFTVPVMWATQNKIVNGYADQTFRPGANVSREQLATMLFNFAKLQGLDISGRVNLAAYKDSSQISEYAKIGLSWAIKNGILSGNAAGELMPKKEATRAEAAKMLLNFTKLMDAAE